ncbi:DISARM system phospholipase D-like protein DrmC (plasmid) [Nocardia sp. NBC_01377]|uniref:DISARM system phospholipase D-like protein DrmC n=1 Tax=Nocardia sp. NBC_01377 TaxID=2903595 RepID=UPI002F90F789
MTTADVIRLAVQLSRELPAQDVRRLAIAVRGGPAALQKYSAGSAGVAVRDACQRLMAAALSAKDCDLAAGAMLGALEADPRVAAIDVVWTGPDSGLATSRLTSAVVVDLIDQAVTEILLVGYAVHTEPSVAAALTRASDRNVAITLLLERHADNVHFSGTGAAFPGLVAQRLSWPAGERPAGASLHAKVLVVDETSALIGSANVTGAALERNLECGLLLTGGPVPGNIRSHVRRLVDRGLMRKLA